MSRRKFRGRGGGTLGPPLQQISITGADLLIARLMSSEPTAVYAGQGTFTTSSWSASAYQEAAALKVLNWPAELTGAVLQTATLRLYRGNGYSADGGTLYAKKILRAAVYNQVTWNVYASGNNWGTAGAGSAGVDVVAAEVSSIALPAGESGFGFVTLPTSVDFLALMQGHLDGSITNNGVLLMPSVGEGTGIHSFDGPTGLNPPLLAFTFIVP